MSTSKNRSGKNNESPSSGSSAKFEQWPRKFAQSIIRESSLEKRREMLSKVPQHLQEMVKTHVQNHWNRRG